MQLSFIIIIILPVPFMGISRIEHTQESTEQRTHSNLRTTHACWHLRLDTFRIILMLFDPYFISRVTPPSDFKRLRTLILIFSWSGNNTMIEADSFNTELIWLADVSNNIWLLEKYHAQLLLIQSRAAFPISGCTSGRWRSYCERNTIASLSTCYLCTRCNAFWLWIANSSLSVWWMLSQQFHERDRSRSPLKDRMCDRMCSKSIINAKPTCK